METLMKRCSKCSKEYPTTAESFYRNKSAKDGFDSHCKKCHNKYNQSEKGKTVLKKYYRTEKGQKTHRKANYKRMYGITLAEYDQMFEAQNGICAICGRPETVKRNGAVRRLAVDHDHNTGKVRGLLCNRCNIVLSYANDDAGILSKMTSYILGDGQ